jgi:hypothetical protein
MDDAVLEHVINQIANATVIKDPYPHFYVDQLFPEDFYQEILLNLPDSSSYLGMGDTGKVDPRTYQERLVLPITQPEIERASFTELFFWSKFSLAINSDAWISMLMEKFNDPIKSRFQKHLDHVKFSSFAELVRDKSNYFIGPHTDHPTRVITLLFYFPKTIDHAHLGTSVYKPKDPSFTCEGFSHHPLKDFDKIHTASFIPNSLFGFFKSDSSFHGVEPIKDQNIERNLMNYYLQWNHK